MNKRRLGPASPPTSMQGTPPFQSEVVAPTIEDLRRAGIRLTRDQLAELKRLATAPQPSYGKGRVRVHNNLRRHGLATIDHSDGFVCRITQAGREFLAGGSKP